MRRSETRLLNLKAFLVKPRKPNKDSLEYDLEHYHEDPVWVLRLRQTPVTI